MFVPTRTSPPDSPAALPFAPLALLALLACNGGTAPEETESASISEGDTETTQPSGTSSSASSSSSTAATESTTGTSSTSSTSSTSDTTGTTATSGTSAATDPTTTGTSDSETDTDAGTSETSADATILIDADFEGTRSGDYSEDMVEADFGAEPSWNNGLDEGRATVESEGNNTYLRVTYPKDEYGPSKGGVQFKVLFDGAYDEVYLRYRVRFGEAFEWVKGGKLPGLIGGTAPTGCKSDDSGFSARMMWRAEGLPVQYLYYPTKVENCGDDFPYEVGGDEASFAPGTWHTVEHRIVMNDPGSSNGVMQAWIDGELALDLQDFAWRGEGKDYAVDGLYFSTFYGGGDDSWAPSSDQTVDYDDFLATTP